MKVYLCDRCGKLINGEPPHNLLVYFERIELNNVELCEQCYQTIKEVLEDGEIK